ncbi:MAG: PEP-CTERM sorting domain-containing protein [Deferrisomatales bacterium]|nr:PEP-CTERM sorting domain-containing protein [Deferrisomatales bacterium]
MTGMWPARLVWLALVVVVAATPAHAAQITTTGVPVRALDADASGAIDLDVVIDGFGGFDLFYSVDNAGWQALVENPTGPEIALTGLPGFGAVLDFALESTGDADTAMDLIASRQGDALLRFQTQVPEGWQTLVVGWLDGGLGRLEIASVRGADALTPVPEPSTVLLLGSGVVGLGMMGRKRAGRGG